MDDKYLATEAVNLNVLEIPITYHPRAGESKRNAIRGAARHFHFMLKYKIRHNTHQADN